MVGIVRAVCALAALVIVLGTQGASATNRGTHGHSRPSHRHPAAQARHARTTASRARSAGHSRAQRTSSTSSARYLVLFVLDGARPDYFGLTRLPHVDALRAHGTQFTNTIDGILESETPAGHTALSTGSTPRRNGILGFNWAQNDNDFSLFDPNVVRSGAMEHIIQNSHAPTLASLFKKRYPGSKVVALSGHKYYAADPLGGPQADAIMYFQGDAKGRYIPVAIPWHVPPAHVLNAPGLTMPTTRLPQGMDDTLAVKLGIAAFRVMRPRILLINVPEFDWPLGHVYGGTMDRGRVTALMKSFDRDLGMIEDTYRKAGVLSQTLFVITSDHGMAPVKRFISADVVKDAVARAHTTTTSIAYNHSVYLWLKDEHKAGTVARYIVRARDPGVKSVYYLTTSGHRQRYVRVSGTWLRPEVEAANQYLLGTLMNGHQPAVVVFCRQDATFSSSSTHWKADHGGASWQSQHIPLILSGPGIRSGAVIGQPAQLADVAPTILADMGASSTGMEGRVLTDALRHTTASTLHARAVEIRRLQPVVRALILQDVNERHYSSSK